MQKKQKNKESINKSTKESIKHSAISSNYSESDNNYTESEEKSHDANVETNAGTNIRTNVDANVETNVNIDEDEEIKKKAKQTFIQTDFLEKVIKYIKTDNLIRKETVEFREKMTTLKEEKQDLETFILRYLDFQEENVININGSGKLTKYESVRKKGMNKDMIQQAICDQIKKEKLVTDDTKIKEIADATYNIIENSREKTVKTVLKRTFIKEKKEKAKGKGKANSKKENNNINDADDADEKPKKVKKVKNKEKKIE